MPESWAEELASRGHRVEKHPALDSGFGHAHAIVVEPTGMLAGAADPQSRGRLRRRPLTERQYAWASMHPLRLRHATLEDGSIADVLVVDGRVAAVGAAAEVDDAVLGLDPADVHDLTGWLLLPAPAEPHAHLDKAFLAEAVPNPTGDLLGAIEAMEATATSSPAEDTLERADRAVAAPRRQRDHGDPHPRRRDLGNGLRSVEALLRVRDRAGTTWRTSRSCALVRLPIGGAAGPSTVRCCAPRWRRARRGRRVPAPRRRPLAGPRVLLEIAAEAGVHRPAHRRDARSRQCWGCRPRRAGGGDRVPLPVTASHCVSLGMWTTSAEQAASPSGWPRRASRWSRNRNTNLFLQSRGRPRPFPGG